MSYVDLAWPYGLVLLGVQTLLFTTPGNAAGYIIGVLYLIAGGRLALMATIAWRTNHGHHLYVRHGLDGAASATHGQHLFAADGAVLSAATGATGISTAAAIADLIFE